MIGIIILNFNNYAVTVDCVNSILNFPPKEDYKIILIDNGSKNESVKVLDEKFGSNSNIQIEVLENNIGYARANNYGLKICDKYGINECILSNSDVVFMQGSIDKLVKDIRELDNAIIVGPKIYNPILKMVQHSSRLSRPSILEPLELKRFMPKDPEIDEFSSKEIHDVYLVSGCCFIIDVKKFKSIGCFDENTFLYNEENILGAKIENSEFKVYMDLSIEVKHVHGASSGVRNTFVSVELLKSTLYYWKTYRKLPVAVLYIFFVIYMIKMSMLSFFNNELSVRKIFREGYLYLHSLCRL